MHDVPDAHDADGGLAELGLLIQEGAVGAMKSATLKCLYKTWQRLTKRCPEKREGEAMLIVS